MYPSKLGVIKLKGDENILNISNYKFGDRHIEVLSKGI